MKYFPLLICFFAVSCMDSKDAKNVFASDKEAQPQELCFLSVIGENVQDSLKMNLQIEDEKVTGTYHWLPAEKDSRKGKIKATKSGNSIEGEYDFMQEGKKQNLPIRIELKGNSATVITNPGMPDKMVVEIEKIACKD